MNIEAILKNQEKRISKLEENMKRAEELIGNLQSDRDELERRVF